MSPDRFAPMAALSYVTARTTSRLACRIPGDGTTRRNANGDLRAVFQNGVSFQATILYTPLAFGDKLKADFGVFCAGLLRPSSA